MENRELSQGVGDFIVSRTEVLEMSPQELVNYFVRLEQEGKLESFLERSAADDALVAKISYWEKWLGKDHRTLVDRVVKEKKELYPGTSDSLPLELEKKFNDEELRLIFSNLGAIQITFGCSKGCPLCGLDAVPGVREHIPYSQLANLFQKFGLEVGTHEPLIYWASEPFDYKYEDKTYEDVHQLAVEYGDYTPRIVTNEKKDKNWLEFLKSGKVAKYAVSAFGKQEKDVATLRAMRLPIIGVGQEHKTGIGVDAKKGLNSNPRAGVGCQNGVMISPRGLYNIVLSTGLTEKEPQGQFVVPIESVADDFEIKEGAKVEEILKCGVVLNTWYGFSPAGNNFCVLFKNKEYFVIYENGKVKKAYELYDVPDEVLYNYDVTRFFKERFFSLEFRNWPYSGEKEARKKYFEKYEKLIVSAGLEGGDFIDMFTLKFKSWGTVLMKWMKVYRESRKNGLSQKAEDSYRDYMGDWSKKYEQTLLKILESGDRNALSNFCLLIADGIPVVE